VSLYRAAPLAWVVLAAVYGAAMTVLAAIPLVGGMAASLVGPVLAAGLLVGAADVSDGRPLRVRRLLHGFADGAALPRLLGLGATVLAVNIGVFVVLLVWAAASVLPVLMSGPAGGISDAWLIGQITGVAVLVLVVLTVYLLLACALLYGLPLVVLRGNRVWPALRSSVVECLRNWLPWLVASLPLLLLAALLTGAVALPIYGGVATDVARLATQLPSNPLALVDAIPVRLVIAPLLAGFVVQTLFAPLAVGVLYCSFRDVYGVAETQPEE
jgi:hypothetical protein